MANRPRSLVRRYSGVGLAPGSGNTTDIALTELPAKTTPIMADSVALIDSEATNASSKATLTNCLKILGETAAGSAAASGLTEVDGVLKVNPTDELMVPASGFFLTQNAAGAPHKEAVADAVALIAGTASATGLAAAAGVLTVTPSDATLTPAADSIMFVTGAGVPKKESAADLATLMTDNSTLAAAAGVMSIKAGGVGNAQLAAANTKGITQMPMSFETGEQAAAKVYFPFKVTINTILGTVTKAIAASDNGTITGANTDGASAGGVITAVASDALNVEYSVTPTTNNVVLANGFYKLTALKSTAGGKVLCTLHWTRTA
jgi:hypothetical protein